MLRDGMNSTLGILDSTGALATRFTYEPFGRTTFSGSASSNLYRFAGRELDATGLYFMRARYYNPILQRFLSPDPLGFGGGSPDLYAYAFNAPTNFIDPLGLAASGCGAGPSGAPPDSGIPQLCSKGHCSAFDMAALPTSPEGFAVLLGYGDNETGYFPAVDLEELPGFFGAGSLGITTAGAGGFEGGLVPVVTVRTPTPTPSVINIFAFGGVRAVVMAIRAGKITFQQAAEVIPPDLLYEEMFREAIQEAPSTPVLPPPTNPSDFLSGGFVQL